MTKKAETQAELEQWTTALTELQGQRADVERQLDELKATAESLREQDVRKGVPIAELAALGERQASLRSVLATCDELLARTRASLQEAKAKANASAIASLREPERASFERILTACDELYAAIREADKVWRQLAELGGTPACSVPRELLNLVEPGLYGQRQWWGQLRRS